ncbi:hypothetical protein EDB80DRAFT_312331 [Ilyonectria destructans]|nr:hypothetical protein EDB80DRAFT_312331 [Ilyonectria destructans]
MSPKDKDSLDRQLEEFIELQLDLPERPTVSTSREPSVVPTQPTTENETMVVLLGIDLDALLDSSLIQAFNGGQDSYNPPSSAPIDWHAAPMTDPCDWMAITNQPRASADPFTKSTPELLVALNQSLIARVRALEQSKRYTDQLMADYYDRVKKQKNIGRRRTIFCRPFLS